MEKIKLLQNILLIITLLNCNYIKALILTDAQIAVQQIHYFSQEATEVYIVWGINNWKLQDKELWPEGTFKKGKFLYTQMKSNDGVFTVNLKVRPKTQIDFKFTVIKGAMKKNVPIWEANRSNQNDYHTIVLKDNTIRINSIQSRNKTVESPPEDITLINYSRKLLFGEKKKPLSNQKIILTDPLTSKTMTEITDQYGDFTFKNLNINTTYKVEIPVDTLLLKKPKRKDDSNNNFNIDLKQNEFPELAAYKYIILEVGNENTNFDKSYLTTKWDSIILMEGPEKGGNYKIALEKAGGNLEFITYPVFEGANFDIALKEYEEKIISNRSLLNGERLYMAKTDGTIIKQFEKGEGSFSYELLPTEHTALLREKEIDPDLSNAFDKSKLTAKGYGQTQNNNKSKKSIDSPKSDQKIKKHKKIRLFRQNRRYRKGANLFSALENGVSKGD